MIPPTNPGSFGLSGWIRVSVLLLATGLLANLTGCVSADEHKRLQVAFDQSRQQLAEADHELADDRTQITDLQAKIADLNKLLDAGSGGVAALKRERDLLAAQLADLQKKYDELLKMTNSGPALPAPINDALRDLAAKYPNLLEFDEKLGMIRFKSDFTFDKGSTVVKEDARKALAEFAHILNMPEIAKNEVQVVGHTDDIPISAGGPTATRNPDNWTLSTNRAWSVLEVLRTNGLSEARGMAAGWGDQRPIAPNAPGKKGSEKNRRVDIFIRPTTVPEGIVVSTPGPAGPVHTPSTKPAPRGPARPAAPAPTVPVPIPG